MSETNKTYRIRTDIGTNKNITVKLDQDYNAFEILSLKLGQEDTYRLQTVDYGVIAGRVLANGGFGVPNAKISVFIETEESQFKNVVLAQIYPYTSTRDTVDGVRYNLLPDQKVDDCHRPVGTFPSKTYVLDNDDIIEVFDKYYKYTTRTNNSGDYIICGVPVGNHTIHMDLDLSDCGILSQRPRDFYYKGYNVEQFDNANQFKVSENLDSLSQIFSQDQSVDVIPFWGNMSQGETIGITRCDIDVNFKFEPTCVFMGSIISDNSSNGISRKCLATNTMGAMDEMVTGEGTIEMIRKTMDGEVEEVRIKGTELINGNGVWCYQIPMNLDYMVTDEYGNMVPTDNPNKGIPTRTSVRFRVSMHDTEENTDNYFLSKVLVPNNPSAETEVDFNFGSETKDSSFRDLFWNNVYSIKSYIPRIQHSFITRNERFTGVKHTNIHGNNNPMPYNNIRIRLPLMFTILCALIKTYIRVVYYVNGFINFYVGVLSFLTRMALVFDRDQRVGFYNNALKTKYTVLADGLCPDLENWYFSPTFSNAIHYFDYYTSFGTGDGEPVNTLQVTFDGLKDSEGVSDKKSIDYTNSDLGNSVCLTTNVDYLVSCVEMNLAQEYRVINFDFYNDWVNGTVYIPRWNKYVTKKRSYLFGAIKIPAKIKGCLTSAGGGNNSISYTGTRRYVQQCSLKYNIYNNQNPIISSKKGCKNNEIQKCHGSYGFEKYPIFGGNGGVIAEGITSKNQYVYYVKPCEWNGTGSLKKKVNLFATDIILLGTLNDCSQEGLPQAFKHLSSTTYLMPTNLALTNMDSDAYLYATSDGTVCNTNRFEKTVNPITTQTFTNTDKYYAGTSENVQHTSIDDYVTLTEAAGIAWNYTGPDQGVADYKNQFYQPGGHFLGISCFNSETNIKSCVNLSRICEAGVNMSERKEVVRGVSGSENAGYEYKLSYFIPTGFIGKDSIVDEDFRTMFATMNHKRLIADSYDEKTGFLKYSFSYKQPSAFDGSIEKITEQDRRFGNMYNTAMTQYITVNDTYQGERDTELKQNSFTRTVKAQNKDYYFFRLGIDSYTTQSSKYLNVSGSVASLPMYENSFYFYFGLRPGATALDELNKQFFASCEDNDTIES